MVKEHCPDWFHTVDGGGRSALNCRGSAEHEIAGGFFRGSLTVKATMSWFATLLHFGSEIWAVAV